VVTNLIKNSIQAIEQNQTKNPRVDINVFSEKEKVVITVKDNGQGVMDENKDKVFEPKFTTKSSGMGLGLAMVKKIVNNYGGDITFISEEGKGTTFKVIFPK
jgi:signal transduction histidine kinase